MAGGIGVLVAMYRIPPVEAFGVLRMASQGSNVTLHSAADAIVAWAFAGRFRNPPARS
ncbi:ANTAR domain-containing protein [Streptomyces sp. 1222.5]|uniref:ANTAR domain-containing protein n=1 Tax=Streptomyces sp. 1222.5 TaxID=1881026 RepID=UPI003EB7C2BC